MSDETRDSTGLVVLLSGDMFFGMRVRTVMRQLGYTLAIVKEPGTFAEQLSGEAVLGLVDFNQPRDWADLATAIETAVPIVAFGSHTDVEGFRGAKAAGVARVVSNGEFSRSLPALAEKYRRAPA